MLPQQKITYLNLSQSLRFIQLLGTIFLEGVRGET